MSTRTIGKWLGRRLLPALKPKLELQSYVGARIPPFDAPEHAEEWPTFAADLRRRLLQEVIFKGVPPSWRHEGCAVEWGEAVSAGRGYGLRKLRYEALPGLWIPAVLYEPEGLSGRAPAVLNLNGHVGPVGKAIDYQQIRCINLAKRGMLALNPDWLYFGELQGEMYAHNRAAYLDLCGVAGVAVFYLAMQRGLEVLLAHAHTDPERVAVTGLSGGGWQTILLSALDTRVRLAAPNAGYIGLEQRTECQGDIGDLEQNASDLVYVADYTWLTALLAPRPALLIYNQKDECCFQAPRARASVYEPVLPLYRALGAESHFRFHVNHDPGTHNYELDNRQQFYRFLNDEGYAGSTRQDDEIACAGEVRSPEELTVGLPEGNADLRSVALGLARGLPRQRLRAHSPAGLEAWQEQARPRLRELLRYRETALRATIMWEGERDGWLVRNWELAVEDCALTLPAVELEPLGCEPTGSLVAVADKGRGSLASVVERARTRNLRVLALDVVFSGEYCVPETAPWQWPMMLGTLGLRPLALQAAQMSAAARWQIERYAAPASLLGLGRQAGIAALVASALGLTVAQVVAAEAHISLKLLAERGVAYDDCPTLFAFGLLEQFDVRELIALSLPGDVVLVRPEGGAGRVRLELAPLLRLFGGAEETPGVTVLADW